MISMQMSVRLTRSFVLEIGTGSRLFLDRFQRSVIEPLVPPLDHLFDPFGQLPSL
ncbi:hypothetical protein BgiBS90_000725 [Biomphalaria glabrata]|nr:hypothetical protein BgiBS90_000725 [Biomphalaria glabrata]